MKTKMVEKINVTFLGTGSAIPTARRNHPAMLLKYKAESILIDCGEGTQRQFRKAGLNPCRVTKILISHWHGDHVLGLPGLLQTMMLNGYNRRLEIYGPKGTKEKIRLYLDLFVRKGEKLDLIVKEVSNGVVFDGDDFYIEAAEMNHDCPAVGYSFVVKEKVRLDREKLAKLKIPNSPLVGELVKGKTVDIGGKKVDGKKLMYKEMGRKVSFVMDTGYNENAVKLAKGADVLVCEATYSAEDNEVVKERKHLSSVDAAKIAKRAKVKGLALVHLSQRYEGIPKKILEEAKTVFGSVIIPEDLEEVEL
jgi:ribonuclease Z